MLRKLTHVFSNYFPFPYSHPTFPKLEHELDLSMDYAASILLNDLNSAKVIIAIQGIGEPVKVPEKTREIFVANHKKLKNRFGDFLFTDVSKFRKAKSGILALPVTNLGKMHFRGIDIPDVDAIVVADMPNHINSLIHLTGRVGRAEFKQGLAICLVNSKIDEKIQEQFVEIAEKTGNPGLFLVNADSRLDQDFDTESENLSPKSKTEDLHEVYPEKINSENSENSDFNEFHEFQNKFSKK